MLAVIKIPGMKIFEQALLRELLLSFTLSLSILTLALFVQQMLRFSVVFLDSGIPFTLFLRFLFYILPFFLVLTIPIAALMSTLLTMSRMHSDREYAALQSAGISLYRLLVPVMAFASVLTLSALCISLILQPWIGSVLKKQFYESLKNQRSFNLEAGVFNIFFNEVVYFDQFIPPSKIKGVLVSDRLPAVSSQGVPSMESRIVTAEEGGILVDPATSSIFLRLRHGSVHRLADHNYQVMSFASYTLKLGVDDPIQKSSGILKSQWTMGIQEFRLLLKRLSLDPQARDLYRSVLLDYHKKFALPTATLILALLGVPIGILIGSSNRVAGFGSGIVIVLFYYLLMVTADSLSQATTLSPALAAWIPNILTTLLFLRILKTVARR